VWYVGHVVSQCPWNNTLAPSRQGCLPHWWCFHPPRGGVHAVNTWHVCSCAVIGLTSRHMLSLPWSQPLHPAWLFGHIHPCKSGHCMGVLVVSTVISHSALLSGPAAHRQDADGTPAGLQGELHLLHPLMCLSGLRLLAPHPIAAGAEGRWTASGLAAGGSRVVLQEPCAARAPHGVSALTPQTSPHPMPPQHPSPPVTTHTAPCRLT
jgi:hypothetical protein